MWLKVALNAAKSPSIVMTLEKPGKLREFFSPTLWAPWMLFELRIRVDPGNHMLHGGSDPPLEGAILKGEKERPIVKYSNSLP